MEYRLAENRDRPAKHEIERSTISPHDHSPRIAELTHHSPRPLLRRIGILGGDRDDGRNGIRSRERRAAGGHAVQHAAQTEQIASGIDRLAARLLGSHVSRGADNGAVLGELPDGESRRLE